MQIQDERGYLIMAVNTDNVDYVACASRLADSLRYWHPTCKICLITDREVHAPMFDYVKLLPYGDRSADTSWKLSNDWQCWAASPFRQTIKLEADMLATSPIDHWWNLLEKRDVVISTGCRDINDQPQTNRYYRRVFDVNHLPDVYNAVTYWRLSPLAKQFWELVRDIFENWNVYQQLIKFPDDIPTTDLVYAIAAEIVGRDLVTMPWASYPKIVHMKQRLLSTRSSNWTEEMIAELHDGNLRINTISQFGLVHYHVKDWDPYAR